MKHSLGIFSAIFALCIGLRAQDKPVLDPNQYIVKDISYEYDLISGKVNQVSYQQGGDDQLLHRYEYDGDNRITAVYTSTNGVDWTRDASYRYYAHGPLAKTDLGALNVETQDYAYTLQGWVKGLRGQGFSYALGYHGTDYKGINAAAYGGEQVGLRATPIANNAGGKSTGLYNGNIATWATNTPALSTKGADNMTNQYTYDQLNRIKGSALLGKGDQYRTKYSYDANGNITDLQRYTGTKDKDLNTITPQLMDNFHYNYESKGAGHLANTNKLRSVDDAVKGQLSPTLNAEDLSADDLEDQDIDNYQYDDIGNLNYDRQEDIVKIEWTVYGKVRAVIRNENSPKPNLVFEYDASGNRVSKIAIKGADVKKTLYIRDAIGNVMGTYTGTSSLTLDEQYLYGSARLGVLDNEGRSYELSDHLGNVRTVVNEYMEVKAAYEYYAFGMSLAKIDNGYRYGFNGKEYIEGLNAQDYGFRMYNPVTGRFFSVDPLSEEYPYYSTYQFAGNKPILYIDRDGLEEAKYLIPDGKAAKIIQPNQWQAKYSAWKYGKTAMERINPNLYYKNRQTQATTEAIHVAVATSIILVDVFVTRGYLSATLSLSALGESMHETDLAYEAKARGDMVKYHAHLKKSGEHASELILDVLFFAGGKAINYARKFNVKLKDLNTNFKYKSKLLNEKGLTIWNDAEATKYLDHIGGEAAYMTAEGDAGILILRENAGPQEIAEEIIHHNQKLKYGEDFFLKNRNKIEVEAQDELLKMGKAEGWSKAEMDRIQSAKEVWQKALDNEKKN